MAGPRIKSVPAFEALDGVCRRVLDLPWTSHYATSVRAFAVLVATVGGVGYVPVAPGTAGSLVAVPLLPLLAALRARTPLPGWLVVVALLLVAFWAADRADRVFAGHDDGRIVIDEVAGMVVAGLFVPGTWGAAMLVLVLFRILDVTKPWPASLIDRRVPFGLGVVGDDLVAGVYAGAGARLLLGFA
jgi:phosphatidylglycerophosphatase A